MAIVGLDHVQIAAPPGCEADARRFYGGVLGLAELPKPPALAARTWARVQDYADAKDAVVAEILGES